MAKTTASKKHKHEEDDVEHSVIVTESEANVANELINERRQHREALHNMHLVYRREDARRILESMPYQSGQMLPMVRLKGPHKRLSWMHVDTNGLASDLKIKFDYYCKIGADTKATAAHNLMKKVEDAKATVKKS